MSRPPWGRPENEIARSGQPRSPTLVIPSAAVAPPTPPTAWVAVALGAARVAVAASPTATASAVTLRTQMVGEDRRV